MAEALVHELEQQLASDSADSRAKVWGRASSGVRVRARLG